MNKPIIAEVQCTACDWIGESADLKIQHDQHDLLYYCPECGEAEFVVFKNKEIEMFNSNMVRQAKNFRSETGYAGGVVLFFDGEIYGWKNELRDPQAEKPGVIAIDESGSQWVARGGCAYFGAERWEKLWESE